MFTKKGAGGLQQPYIPAGNGEESGEYSSFDSTKLNERVKLVAEIIGYDKTIEQAYNKFNPPLFEGTHFNERLKERKIHKIFIAEALLKPLKISDKIIDKYGRISIKYYGPNATVILNPATGKIITAHLTRKNIRNKYKEK